MKFICLYLVLLFLASCTNFDATQQLSAEEKEELEISLAAYIEKKPAEFSYKERFLPGNRSYYKRAKDHYNLELTSYYKTDSNIFFMVMKDEPRSLWPAKRAVGGEYRQDSTGKISFLNIHFYSGYLKAEEAKSKGDELFQEMVNTGNVARYLGNADYVEWPSDDVRYDTEKNKWYFVEGSETHALYQHIRDARETE